MKSYFWWWPQKVYTIRGLICFVREFSMAYFYFLFSFISMPIFISQFFIYVEFSTVSLFVISHLNCIRMVCFYSIWIGLFVKSFEKFFLFHNDKSTSVQRRVRPVFVSRSAEVEREIEEKKKTTVRQLYDILL